MGALRRLRRNDLRAVADPGMDVGEASPTVPSWNQIVDWLRELDLLRQAEAA